MPPPVSACSTPSALSLTYNLKDVGMDYDRSLFGMKLSDCRNLAKVLVGWVGGWEGNA